MTTETPVTEMSFEQAMQELERVVDQLERGDVALDASIALYERGAALKKRCEDELKRADVLGLSASNQRLDPGAVPARFPGACGNYPYRTLA